MPQLDAGSGACGPGIDQSTANPDESPADFVEIFTPRRTSAQPRAATAMPKTKGGGVPVCMPP